MLFEEDGFCANFNFDKCEITLNSKNTEILFDELSIQKLTDSIRSIDLALVFGMKVVDTLTENIGLKIKSQQVIFTQQSKEIILSRSEWNTLKNRLMVSVIALHSQLASDLLQE